MSTIYLITTRGQLKKRGQTLLLKMDDDTTRTIFPYKTEQLVLIGNIDISTPALKMLMHRRIDTVFVNKNGRYNGRLAFSMGKNVFLRQKQFDRLHDEAFCLQIARDIAVGKMKNQLHFLLRIGRGGVYKGSVAEESQKVKELIRRAEKAENTASLRGFEGSAARYYFKVLGRALVPDFARFNGRSMNPPEDNVNAVLSFIYTLVLYRVDAALEMEGLDPHVGYFHSIEYGKRSLSFDLMEEYRAAIADPLTLSLFNLGILKKDDFRTVEFSGADEDFPLDIPQEHEAIESKKGVLLNQQGLRKVLMQFEKKLATEIFYQPMQSKISYKKIILLQVKHFRRVLNGEERRYKSLIIK